MKGILKKIISVLLAVIMIFSIVPTQVFAIDENISDTGNISTENNAESSLESSTRMKATNPLANAINDAYDKDEAAEQEKNGQDFSITKLTIVGTNATVEYRAADDCYVIVGLYNENNDKMYTSVSKKISKDEKITELFFSEEEMPELYIAKAYLTDADGNPLCKCYIDNEHTKLVEDFKNTKVSDFDSEDIIYKSDNEKCFVVASSDAINFVSTATVNIILVNDFEHNRYVIGNPSSDLLKIKRGDVIYIDAPDDYILCKVYSTEIDGDGNLVILQDDDVSLGDLFDYIRIDTNLINDNSDQIQTQSADIKEQKPLTGEIPVSIETDDESSDEEDLVKAEIKTDFEIKFTGKFVCDCELLFEYDIRWGEDGYILSLKNDSKLELNVELKIMAKASFEIKLPICEAPTPIAGLIFVVKVTFTFEVSAQVITNGTITVQTHNSFIRKRNIDGQADFVSNDSEDPEFKPELETEVKAELSISLRIDLGFKLLKVMKFMVYGEGELTADLSLFKTKISSEEISASFFDKEGLTASSVPAYEHDCTFCIKAKLDAKITAGLKLGVDLNELLKDKDKDEDNKTEEDSEAKFNKVFKATFEPKLEWTFDLGYARLSYYDGHLDFEYQKDGEIDCPHMKYLTTFEAVDATDPSKNVVDVRLRIERIVDKTNAEYEYLSEIPECVEIRTDSKGCASCYLPSFKYKITVISDNYKLFSSIPDISEMIVTDDFATSYKLFMQKDYIVNVNLTDNAGTPLEGATISCDNSNRTTDSKGKCSFQLQPGEYTFKVKYKDDIRNYDVTVDEDNQNVDLKFDAGTPITFHVVNKYGSPLQDAEVTVVGKNPIRTNSNGNAVMYLKEGTYDANIFLYNDGDNREVVVDDKGTPQTIEVKLGLGYRVNVTVEDYGGLPIKDVYVYDDKYTDENGKCVIYLDKGDYTITFDGDTGGKDTVTFSVVDRTVDVTVTLKTYFNAVIRGTTLYVNGCGPLKTIPNDFTDEQKKSVTSVVIGYGITEIGSSVFKDFPNIASADLPDSLEGLSYDAFDNTKLCDSEYIDHWLYNARSYSDYTVDNGTIGIADRAFAVVAYNAYRFNEHLKSVTIPEGVMYIGDGAFNACTKLTSITIPDSVVSIGVNAFAECTELTNVTMPCSALCAVYKSNYDGKICTIFDDCNKIEKLVITKGSGIMRDYDYFYYVTWSDSRENIKEIVIEDGVTNIGEYAFYGCTGLTNVTIPDSVTSIGNWAFYRCTGLNEVTIPDSVISIGEYAFYGCRGLTNITISDSVTSIDRSAFSCCTGLTSITIPDGVTSIGYSVFSGCTGLTSIAIPNSVTSIGDDAFELCTGLKELTLPDSVKSIGYGSFSGCTGLTSIAIPDSVTNIGKGAFELCTSLINITIPDSVTSIGDSAFYGCSGLKELTIPCSTTFSSGTFSGCTNLEKVVIAKGTGIMTNYSLNDYQNTPWYISQDSLKDIIVVYGVTNISAYAFYYNTKITSVILPDSIKSIGNWAFSRCTGLTSITIPDGVTSIGYGAFSGCTDLKELFIPCSAVFSSSIFSNCSNLEKVTITKGTGIMPNYATNATPYKSNIREIVIGNGVINIGDCAFYGCTDLTTITISDSVTSIGDYAFWNCKGLMTVNITDVSSWCNIVFGKDNSAYSSARSSSNPLYYAKNLCLNGNLVTDLTIPNGVESIRAYAFYGFTGLTSVKIPDSVTSIGGEAFYGCTGLKELTIPCSVEYFSDSSFSGCSNLEKVVLTEGASIMPAYKNQGRDLPWHRNSDNIKEVIIEDGVKNIGAFAFDGCTSLTSVTISDSVTSIDRSAFSCCTGLTSITIPDSVTNIDYGAFELCTGLKELTLPDSVKSIGNWAFSRCTGLTSITIPDSVTSIGNDAFYDCPLENVVLGKGLQKIPSTLINEQYLKTVVIPDSITSIGDNTFKNCTSLTSITIPDSVTSIGDYAFYGCTGLKELTIPCSVEFSNDSSFRDCSNIEKVVITKGTGIMTNYSYSNFNRAPWDKSRDKIKEIIIEDGVKSIGDYAFYRCTGLNEVTIPDSVIRIGSYAFSSTGVTSITIPDSVTSIGDDAFNYCTGLKELTIPCSMNYSGSIFYGSSNIEKVVITKGTGIMTDYSWSDYDQTPWYISRDNIREIVIEDGVINIGIDAFEDCTGLTSIALPDTVISIGSMAFYGCTGLKDIVIPESVSNIERYAFYSDNIENMYYNAIRCKDNNKSVYENASITNLYLGSAVKRIPDVFGEYNITNIYYSGTEEEWNRIYGIEMFNGKTIHFETPFEIPSELLVASADTVSVAAAEMSVINNILTAQNDNAANEENAVVTYTVENAVVGNTYMIYVVKSEEESIFDSVNLLFVNQITATEETLEFILENPNFEGYSVIIRSCKLPDEFPHTCDNGFHNEITVRACKATCTENGYSGDVVCSICGEVIHKGNVIYALGHSFIDDVCEHCGILRAEHVESEHPYTNLLCKTYRIEKEGAKRLIITVSNDTYLEEDYDYLSIYDGNGKEISKSTGKESAGKMFFVYGDTVVFKLVTDATNTEYGFSADVTAYYQDCVGEHNIEHIGAYDATCQHNGYTGDAVCKNCGTVVSKGETIGMKPHECEKTVIAPSCTQQGYDFYKCKTCDYQYKDNFTDMIDHQFENGECIMCGLHEGIIDIHLNEFKLVETQNEGDETLFRFIPTESGQYYFFSDSAYDTYGYLYDSEMNELSTNDDGGDGGNFLIRYELVAGQIYYLKGIYYSSRTGSFYVGLTDTYVSCHEKNVLEVIEPTCTSEGYTKYHCSRCNNDFYADYTDSLGHNKSSVVEVVAPTCTSGGYTKYHCDRCSEDFQDDYASSLGHSFESDRCSRCGYTILEIKLGDQKTDDISSGEQIYYKFVPGISGTYCFYSICPKDTYGYLYDADMNELSYNDDGGYGSNFKISYYCNAGETYYISARFYSSYYSGKISVCLENSIPELSADPNSRIVIDLNNKFIYGLNSGIPGYLIKNNYIYCMNNNGYWKVNTTTDNIGTGSTLEFYSYDESDEHNGYTFVIFGDVNGDGWYDGMDAMIVKCIAAGMLSKNDVSEAVYMAADCNHDGVIDDSDVQLLEQAGVLLANVDQSKSNEELLETSSVYNEYLNLIDQRVESEEDSSTNEIVDLGFNNNLFEAIIKFIKYFIGFIKSVFINIV